MKAMRVADLPVPAMPVRKTFPPPCMRSMARCCPASGLKVFRGRMEDVDEVGVEGEFVNVGSIEPSHLVSSGELFADASRFIVIC